MMLLLRIKMEHLGGTVVKHQLQSSVHDLAFHEFEPRIELYVDSLDGKKDFSNTMKVKDLEMGRVSHIIHMDPI